MIDKLKIFDDYQRTDSRPSWFSEPYYTFLNRIQNPEFEKVRKLLETWFKVYPDKDRNRLKSMFISDFQSAFFELFIYAFFTKLNYEAVTHPSIENGKTIKTPDFLFSSESTEFYVEATVAEDLSNQEKKKENILNRVYDSLTEVKSPNFFLDLSDLELKNDKKSPSIRNLRAQLNAAVMEHDPDEVISYMHGNYSLAPYIKYENNDLKAVIRLMPKKEKFRNEDSDTIGILQKGGGIVTVDLSIKKAIEKKAKKYKNSKIPLIIAVNSISPMGIYKIEITDILFGKSSVTIDPKTMVQQPGRRLDGLLYGPKGPRNRNISAVLITTLYPTNIHKLNYQIH